MLLVRSDDVQQFDLEDERLVGSDGAAAALAVSLLGGDVDFPFGADGHHREGFGPARDDAVQGKFRGFVAGVGGVEFGAVDEGAAVVYFHDIGHRGFGAGAGFDDFILDAVREGIDAGTLEIVGEEFAAFLEVIHGTACGEALEVGADEHVHFLGGHLDVLFLEGGVHAGDEDRHVGVTHAHALEVGAEEVADVEGGGVRFVGKGGGGGVHGAALAAEGKDSRREGEEVVFGFHDVFSLKCEC